MIFDFSWDDSRLQYPGEIGKNGYAKLWRVNKVHYGLCENGESGVSRYQGIKIHHLTQMVVTYQLLTK